MKNKIVSYWPSFEPVVDFGNLTAVSLCCVIHSMTDGLLSCLLGIFFLNACMSFMPFLSWKYITNANPLITNQT